MVAASAALVASLGSVSSSLSDGATSIPGTSDSGCSVSASEGETLGIAESEFGSSGVGWLSMMTKPSAVRVVVTSVQGYAIFEASFVCLSGVEGAIGALKRALEREIIREEELEAGQYVGFLGGLCDLRMQTHGSTELGHDLRRHRPLWTDPGFECLKQGRLDDVR